MRTFVPDVWRKVGEKEQRERPWQVGEGQGRAELPQAGGRNDLAGGGEECSLGFGGNRCAKLVKALKWR